MSKMNSFVLLNKYGDIFKDLNDKQAGVLIKAIFEYQIEGKLAHLSDLELKMAFKFIKRDLDYNNSKYQQICQKRAESGQIGGKITSKIKQVLANQANASNCKQMLASASKSSKCKHNDVDVDVDVENEIDKEKKPGGDDKAYSSPRLDGACQTAKQIHPPTAAPQGFLGTGKDRQRPNGNGSHMRKLQHELGGQGKSTGNATAAPSVPAQTPKPQAKPMPQDQSPCANSVGVNAHVKPMTPAAELYEAFKTLYQAQTQFPYNPRREDLTSMEILVKRHGQHAVENKIRILHAACKNAAFWFTKKNFSDFTVQNLVRNWNELVPFETEEERHRKKMDKLLGIKRDK
jgi:hypothetical protein